MRKSALPMGSGFIYSAHNNERPPEGSLSESVKSLTGHRLRVSILRRVTFLSQALTVSQTRCELLGSVIPERQESGRKHNFLAMVRRLSQAEHKHSLTRGAQDVLGVWADTPKRLLRGSRNRSSGIAPPAIQSALKSPYRETALNDSYCLEKAVIS